MTVTIDASGLCSDVPSTCPQDELIINQLRMAFDHYTREFPKQPPRYKPALPPCIDLEQIQQQPMDTQLVFFCTLGRLDLLDACVKQGANMALASRQQKSPLSQALHFGHTHIIRYLTTHFDAKTLTASKPKRLVTYALNCLKHDQYEHFALLVQLEPAFFCSLIGSMYWKHWLSLAIYKGAYRCARWIIEHPEHFLPLSEAFTHLTLRNHQDPQVHTLYPFALFKALEHGQFEDAKVLLDAYVYYLSQTSVGMCRTYIEPPLQSVQNSNPLPSHYPGVNWSAPHTDERSICFLKSLLSQSRPLALLFFAKHYPMVFLHMERQQLFCTMSAPHAIGSEALHQARQHIDPSKSLHACDLKAYGYNFYLLHNPLFFLRQHFDEYKPIWSLSLSLDKRLLLQQYPHPVPSTFPPVHPNLHVCSHLLGILLITSNRSYLQALLQLEPFSSWFKNIFHQWQHGASEWQMLFKAFSDPALYQTLEKHIDFLRLPYPPGVTLFHHALVQPHVVRSFAQKLFTQSLRFDRTTAQSRTDQYIQALQLYQELLSEHVKPSKVIQKMSSQYAQLEAFVLQRITPPKRRTPKSRTISSHRPQRPKFL